MALTKSDLQAIDKIVAKRVRPLEKGQAGLTKSVAKLEKGQVKLEKGIKRLDKKFTKLFNFLYRDWSKLKKRVDYHDKELGVDTSKVTTSF